MNDTTNEFIKMTATQAVTRLRSKEVSPLELVEASIERIETVDIKINALPITVARKFFEGFATLTSIAIVAMPTGGVMAAFSDAFQRMKKD